MTTEKTTSNKQAKKSQGPRLSRQSTNFPSQTEMSPAPSLTRKWHADAYTHILTNVLDQDADSPVTKALTESGNDSLMCFLALTYDQINELTYKDDKGTEKRLRSGHLNVVRAFICYVRFHRVSIDQPLEED